MDAAPRRLPSERVACAFLAVVFSLMTLGTVVWAFEPGSPMDTLAALPQADA